MVYLEDFNQRLKKRNFSEVGYYLDEVSKYMYNISLLSHPEAVAIIFALDMIVIVFRLLCHPKLLDFP